MSEPVRIILRLLGVVLLLGGLAFLVLLVKPGPGEVAEWMGKTCSRGRTFRESVPCTWQDVLGMAWLAPAAILIGFPLALALRPPGKGPFTLDFSRGRAS